MTNQEVPHANESEASVLGCVILEPELLDEVTSKVSPADFHDLRHRNLYELMVSMADESLIIDVQSLRQEAVSRLGNIEKVGGLAYLVSLPDMVASSAHFPYALGVICRKARLRHYDFAAKEILRQLGDKETSDDDKLEYCGSTLAAALQPTGGGELEIADIAREALHQIEQAFEHKGECTGVPTGFPALDRATTGLHPGELVIIAARPGMGKTSLAMGVADWLAVEGDTPVGVLSLEMKSTALVIRAISSRAGIDSRDLRGGTLGKTELPKIAQSVIKISKSNLHLDDSHGISIIEASARIRRMVHRHKCKLIIVDYLQLLHAKAESRVQEVSRISGHLKALSNQLDVPILCLSQLNRSVETQGHRPPRLSDLRDSGSIEQDADQVWFIHRDEPDSHFTRLIIAKNRSGPTGEVDLVFEPQFTRYAEPPPMPEVYVQKPLVNDLVAN